MKKTIQKFYRAIMKKQMSSVGFAALIVSLFGITSRFLGLIRDRMLAANYGAGDVLDVYYAAFRLPDFIFELLIVGSFAAAFIPIFHQLREQKNERKAWELAQDLLLTLFTIIAVLSLLGIIFAPHLMHVIVPGFTDEKITQATAMTRIMFLSPLFLVVSAVLGGVLVSLQRFILYASAPLFYNLGIIMGISVFAPRMHDPIGLAWGVVLGAALHLLIHVVAIRHVPWQWHKPSLFFFRSRDVRRVLFLMVPRIFGSASHQISLLFTTFFTSILAAGSLTIFTFAYNIQSVIMGLIGVSFALAVFPTLSAAFAQKREEDFNNILERTLRRVLYYAIPLSMIFWVLRAQLVRLIYGAGHFDWDDTVMTIHVLSILLLAVFAQVIIPLLARAFYAMHNTKIPLYAALASQILYIAIISIFIIPYGLSAIAYGFVVSTCANAIILLVFVYKKVPHFSFVKIYHGFLAIVLASLVAAFVTHAVKTLLGTIFSLNYVWEVLVQLTVSGLAGMLMYFGMSALFGLQEFETIKNKIIFRIFGRPIVAAEEQHHGTGSGV